MDEKENIINGHEYVDLGLSVLWATCNVGAEKPEEYGEYYAWGETETKALYYPGNSETWQKMTGDIGGTKRDACLIRMGAPWRMPTLSEFQELGNDCDWKWTTMNGKNGYRVTGKNQNSIFLPAGGILNANELRNNNESGHYWTSTPVWTSSQLAYSYCFMDSLIVFIGGMDCDRCLGLPIRSVAPII